MHPNVANRIKMAARRAAKDGMKACDCPYNCDCEKRSLWILHFTEAMINE